VAIDFKFEVGDIVRRRHGETLWRVISTANDQEGNQLIAKVRLEGESSTRPTLMSADSFLLVGRPCKELKGKQYRPLKRVS
jgi:hypothetical protein